MMHFVHIIVALYELIPDYYYIVKDNLGNLCDTRSKDKWNSWFPVLGDKFKPY